MRFAIETFFEAQRGMDIKFRNTIFQRIPFPGAMWWQAWPWKWLVPKPHFGHGLEVALIRASDFSSAPAAALASAQLRPPSCPSQVDAHAVQYGLSHQRHAALAGNAALGWCINLPHLACGHHARSSGGTDSSSMYPKSALSSNSANGAIGSGGLPLSARGSGSVRAPTSKSRRTAAR